MIDVLTALYNENKQRYLLSDVNDKINDIKSSIGNRYVFYYFQAIFEALEETIAELKQQLHEKDISIDTLQSKLHSLLLENENLEKIIR